MPVERVHAHEHVEVAGARHDVARDIEVLEGQVGPAWGALLARDLDQVLDAVDADDGVALLGQPETHVADPTRDVQHADRARCARVGYRAGNERDNLLEHRLVGREMRHHGVVGHAVRDGNHVLERFPKRHTISRPRHGRQGPAAAEGLQLMWHDLSSAHVALRCSFRAHTKRLASPRNVRRMARTEKPDRRTRAANVASSQ